MYLHLLYLNLSSMRGEIMSLFLPPALNPVPNDNGYTLSIC